MAFSLFCGVGVCAFDASVGVKVKSMEAAMAFRFGLVLLLAFLIGMNANSVDSDDGECSLLFQVFFFFFFGIRINQEIFVGWEKITSNV